MKKEKELNFENILRPKYIKDYIGQDNIKNQINTYINAAKIRSDKTLDHILFYGPPGLGKTTIANIIANELKTKIKTVMAPSIEKPIDIVSVLMNIDDGDVLFIDEIHALKRNIEEILYSAMEDFKIEIITEKDVIVLNIPKFTLIGATTRKGLISSPMLDRFGIVLKLEYYKKNDLILILEANSKKINVKYEIDGLKEISKRSRGTPRVANKLLSRVKDFALVENNGVIDKRITKKSLDILGVDENGLEDSDRNVLVNMFKDLKNKPSGIETIAKTCGEEKETLERVIEPFLIKEKLIRRTPKGRVLTDKGILIAENLVKSKREQQ